MIIYSFFNSALQHWGFIMLFYCTTYIYHVAEYCFYFTCFVVNSGTVSSDISYNNLRGDLTKKYEWLFLTWNAISVTYMAFIELMHHNKPQITYLITLLLLASIDLFQCGQYVTACKCC